LVARAVGIAIVTAVNGVGTSMRCVFTEIGVSPM
jgi:Flp pilus assembly pilin Flp